MEDVTKKLPYLHHGHEGALGVSLWQCKRSDLR